MTSSAPNRKPKERASLCKASQVAGPGSVLEGTQAVSWASRVFRLCSEEPWGSHGWVASAPGLQDPTISGRLASLF